jgi:predicted TIM-barrel fold metal-dependent hydrolase
VARRYETLIEAIDWLTAADKQMIFEDNARKLFRLEAIA